MREKRQKQKKHIHTFTMVFPPLQEATSFVVRLQFFRPNEPLLQATSDSRHLSQLMPQSSQKKGYYGEMKLP